MHQLQVAGYKVTHDSPNPRGEIAVINTCGFIADAKEESIQMILRFCQAKQSGHLKKLFVMGCLSQRYADELKQEIPQVDKYYGKFDWKQLLTDLGKAPHTETNPQRTLTTPPHYAYIKISEGCNRQCSYCAIPLITGNHHSRPMENILDEVRTLVDNGVKEFQLIAQELTYYGLDIYHRQTLPQLVQNIANIPGVKWIRLHYAYPADFPYELLPVMRRNKNVCNYLDIALQHISNNILTKMRRHINTQQTQQLIQQLRKQVPGIHLRTTMMVGYPGETEEDFQQLLQFVRTTRFERLGAFSYSEEEGTYSSQNHPDNIDEETKQHRLDRLMHLQQKISQETAAQKVGQTMTVIIDRQEGDYYIGRTEYDSPEVDPEVLIPTTQGTLQIGSFYQAKITDSDEFDLYATIEKQLPQ